MSRKFFLSIAAALVSLAAAAKVQLPNIIGDNMVLQRESKVALWGSAKANAKVVIAPSWTKAKTSVTADGDGKWSARIQTPEAGGPYEISFSDGEKTTLKNILIGEVWFCGGQSNMEMPVKGFSGQPVEGALDVIMDASPATPIRMCTSKRNASCTPAEENQLKWQENTPEAVANTSSVAYFFARQLCRTLGVPVGVISCNWGGSAIEAWISKDYIDRDFKGEFDLSYLEQGITPKNRPHQKPTLLFNGMVKPIVPFTFKGIIWYQGETNRGRAEQYLRLSKTYVEMMRAVWENPEMPFYAVQIAPYRYNDPEDFKSGFLEEAQMKAAQQIPHAGIATTLDIGDPYTIHPAKKKEVGQRLAALALENDYGFKGIHSRAPEFKEMTVKDGKIILSFDVFGDSLAPISKELEGFEVAGADKTFHKATSAKLGKDRKSVEITCDAVPEPVAVRYAFRNLSSASIYNSMCLPVGPFRTDDWDE